MDLVVLFGGVSSEHKISCLSAASVLRNLDHKKYRIHPVGISPEGRWFLYEAGDPARVEDGSWMKESLTPAVLSPDRAAHGLLIQRDGKLEKLRVDCVFPVLHGIGGEDGTVQGLLELAGVPYVGCGVGASADAMDKSVTKVIAQQARVRQAKYYLAQREEFAASPERVTRAAAGAVANTLGGWPVFVKPCSSGSSVGVHKAVDAGSLREGLEEAFRWDSKALVEEFIDGHEVEVAVLGNSAPVASIAGEIAPSQEFYTFDAKYHDETSALYIPAHIGPVAMDAVRAAALRVYRALGCRGLARVDFFVTWEGEEVVLNEINTMPGFTSISMYPKLFAHGGLAYGALLDRLIHLAMEGTHG